ncbi:Transcriptional regulator GlxA family, contains an amidase domain and an AraC-type DNA-binding HTH domain [Kaistia soli DSM 19436]|uniref:Transcriptional regulator GlxA family, contains an amidase domain and an AraC-type DNA-binding HTH domain n=1 Tax=Kaistia soli DSM 19436 TaxID=1122133 RepID=A0A1M5FQU5_9HYPH|nr:GlxA family transcriptional regulator [Kaistia soli]SHF93799.1 Transcriptional regulator GlxA family, contains an amidase domain and an AraC-type DNA-binding HTH domain [Kaistia soli DSM 19436]
MDLPDSICTEVAILCYPDCQLAAVYGLTDLFRIAGEISRDRADGETTPAIRVSHWQLDAFGAEVVCTFDSHPGRPHRLGYVVVPPSLIVPSRMQPMQTLVSWLLAQHGNGTRLCSVCAGAFLAAETGLLDGRDVTTHWAFAAELAERYPQLRVDADRMLIDDGDVVTAGGILAWTDLGLTMVAQQLGPSIMLDTARFLLTDPPGRLQQPFIGFVQRRDHGDEAILKVQNWLQTTNARDHAIEMLAGRAGLGERTFQRRFLKATGLRLTEYAQHIRVAKAREQLETSRRSIEQIAWDVGYGDVSAFRRIFQRLTGLAPADYRRRFGAVLQDPEEPLVPTIP